MKHISIVSILAGVWITAHSAAAQGPAGTQATPAMPTATSAALTTSVAAPQTPATATGTVPPPATGTVPPPATVSSAASASETLLDVPAGRGQPRLRIERRGGVLQLRVCRGPCNARTAVSVTLPDALALRTAFPKTQAEVLALGEGRKAAHVTLENAGQRWELLAAAPLTGDTPRVLFSGFTGLTDGEEPDRSGTRLQIYNKTPTEKDVVLAQVREDVQLCGRDALLTPQLVYAKDLELHRVKLQRIPEAERTAATQLTASAGAGKNVRRVLSTRVASSSVGDPAALTDGDAKTFWAEQRGSSGSGEFVVMRAPAQIELTGFELRLRPEVSEQGNLAAPSSFWLATDDKVYHVQIPSDPWLEGGSVFTVSLPLPIHASCVAVVLESAFGDREKGSDRDVQVSIADIAPTTSIDDAAIAHAILELDAAEAPAHAALELLQALGGSELPALAERFASLTPTGRMRALNVYDAATCEQAAGAYVSALISPATSATPEGIDDRAEYNHITRRLQQCGVPAVRAIRRALPTAKKAEQLELLTQTLSDIAPSETVEALVPMLARTSRAKRRILRRALYSAIKRPATHERVTQWLTDSKLGKVAKIDLLRSLGTQLDKLVPVVEPTLRALLTNDADFRTRYTLLEPLAQASLSRPALLTELTRLLLTDREPAVRTAAARVTPVVASTLNPLIRAAADAEPRVREAAIANLGAKHAESARTVLQLRLKGDAWPFVRSASVRALSTLPPHPETLALLASSVEGDPSAEVRRPAVLALGKLGAREQLPVVRATYELDVDANVRATAAGALGQLCDADQLDLVTDRALTLATLSGSEDELLVAKASLNALGRLAPADLKQRLAPFFNPKTPALARAAAQAALAFPTPCKH